MLTAEAGVSAPSGKPTTALSYLLLALETAWPSCGSLLLLDKHCLSTHGLLLIEPWIP
jgi:hypothetical protein